MVLAVVPCNDIHAQSPNNSKDSYSTISNSEDSHSKDKGDICSPLCTCNCCQITVASFKSEPLPLQKRSLNIFQKRFIFRKMTLRIWYTTKFGNPPRFSFY